MSQTQTVYNAEFKVPFFDKKFKIPVSNASSQKEAKTFVSLSAALAVGCCVAVGLYLHADQYKKKVTESFKQCVQETLPEHKVELNTNSFSFLNYSNSISTDWTPIDDGMGEGNIATRRVYVLNGFDESRVTLQVHMGAKHGIFGVKQIIASNKIKPTRKDNQVLSSMNACVKRAYL